jgi:hypothetical protein
MLAFASGSFAAYMISDSGRQPRFSGAEYFTVFAKLTPGGRETDSAPAQPPAPESSAPDEIRTGSITRKSTAATAEAPSAPAKGIADAATPWATTTLKQYVLRSVTKGVALIESPEGLREVRPGTILPVAGLVTSIEQHEGRWVVVTVRGLIREARR